jgi:NAD(P)-dependent dehydrogenase (short-subunit alcohol dehydrogenase family)
MTAPRFAGQRAFVTGAGSGIGRAAARRLAAEGAHVLGLDLDRDGLEETFADLDDATWVAGDVRSGAATEALRDHGPFDILVNAAGILRRHDLLEHPHDEWLLTLDVNLRAPFRLAREFARAHLEFATPGTIVNVCSIESFTAAPAHAAYTVSKAALLMLTRALALELAEHRIRVNGIAPGVTATAMNADLRADASRSGALLAQIPIGRFGAPEDQAAAICFLASDEAAYITGSVLPVDGGFLTH